MHELPASESTMWHLCWQAALGRQFFADPTLYERVRKLLFEVHRRRGRVLVDYALLPTEIHLVAEIQPGDSVGGVARAIGNVVARWVRAAQPVRSPVLAGPYRASRIGSAHEQRVEARMLAWRSVFHGLCRTPAHYPHAAFRIALGMVSVPGFDARPLLRVFGLSLPQQREALRRWVAERPSERERQAWELTHGLVLAAGGRGAPAAAREMRRAAAAALVAAGGDGIDGALALLETWVAAKLDLRGAHALHTAADGTGARGRGLVGCLAHTHGLCSAAAVARHFGRAKATLSEQMAARRASAEDRQIIATPVPRIIEEALALQEARGKNAAHGRV
jgi:REP element-mobilizing transposase RayT